MHDRQQGVFQPEECGASDPEIASASPSLGRANVATPGARRYGDRAYSLGLYLEETAWKTQRPPHPMTTRT